MIQQYGPRFGECPPAMQCVKQVDISVNIAIPHPGLQVWESWWLQYAEDHQLYTLYTAAQDALAVDHREAVLADTA